MSRLKSLTETSAMYDMFLNQCSEYEMLSDSAKRALPNRGDQIDPATARQEKVERFKRTKEIRTRLEVLDKGRVERLRTALAEADRDDEDPENTNSISPENEKDESERWMLLLEDAVAKTMDSRSVIAKSLCNVRSTCAWGGQEISAANVLKCLPTWAAVETILNEHGVPAALKAELQAEISDCWHDDVTYPCCSSNPFTEVERVANACTDADWSSVETSLDTTIDKIYIEAGIDRSTSSSPSASSVSITSHFSLVAASIMLMFAC